MLVITDAATMARALDQPLNPALKRLLRRRGEQLGDQLEASARFLIVQPFDTLADVERELQFPLVIDEAPTWEWALIHTSRWVEMAFVLSDEGPADVLLVHDANSTDPAVRRLLRRHLASSDARLGTSAA